MVVAVGLVQLEHRELRVVSGGQPLVAEDASQLEHPLEATNDEPLQVELGSDAKEQLHVERVVMGCERLGQRPAGNWMKDRRLHLDELALLEPAPREAEDLAALQEGCATLGVGPEVDVALAVASFGIGDAVPLVAEPASGLREHHPRRYLHGQLALASLHDLASGPHPVAQTDLAEALEVIGERCQCEELHRVAAAVPHRREGELALRSVEHHAPGNGDDDAGLRAISEAVVLGS